MNTTQPQPQPPPQPAPPFCSECVPEWNWQHHGNDRVAEYGTDLPANRNIHRKEAVIDAPNAYTSRSQ